MGPVGTGSRGWRVHPFWIRRSDYVSSKPSGQKGAKVSPEGDKGDGVRDAGKGAA